MRLPSTLSTVLLNLSMADLPDVFNIKSHAHMPMYLNLCLDDCPRIFMTEMAAASCSNTIGVIMDFPFNFYGFVCFLLLFYCLLFGAGVCVCAAVNVPAQVFPSPVLFANF